MVSQYKNLVKYFLMEALMIICYVFLLIPPTISSHNYVDFRIMVDVLYFHRMINTLRMKTFQHGMRQERKKKLTPNETTSCIKDRS